MQVKNSLPSTGLDWSQGWCLWISEQKSVQISIQNKADRNADPEIRKDHIHLQLGELPGWIWTDHHNSRIKEVDWIPSEIVSIPPIPDANLGNQRTELQWRCQYLFVMTHTWQGQHFPLVVSMYYVVSSRKVKIRHGNIFLHQSVNADYSYLWSTY